MVKNSKTFCNLDDIAFAYNKVVDQEVSMEYGTNDESPDPVM